MTKTFSGNFFEDFPRRPDDPPRHPAHRHRSATSRSITACSARVSPCSPPTSLPRRIGYPRSPIDDLLVFHIGVRQDRAGHLAERGRQSRLTPIAASSAPVYPGDTLNAVSEVIGLKENSNSRRPASSIVRSRGFKAGRRASARICALGDGEEARRRARPRRRNRYRDCRRRSLSTRSARPVRRLDPTAYDNVLAGSPHRFGDYNVGEKIDHLAGITVEDAEHHDRDAALSEHARAFTSISLPKGKGRFGRPPDLRRSRYFAGARAVVQRARQCVSCRRDQWRPPCCAAVRRQHRVCLVGSSGEDAKLPRRTDVGALRVRTVATKDKPCDDFPLQESARKTTRR